MNFVAENSNKLQKLNLKGKISQALNVFTLGLTTHATLIRMKDTHHTYVMLLVSTNKISINYLANRYCSKSF